MKRKSKKLIFHKLVTTIFNLKAFLSADQFDLHICEIEPVKPVYHRGARKD